MIEQRRRDILLGAGAVASLALLKGKALAQPAPPERLVPWLDPPAAVPEAAKAVKALTGELDSWITPNEKFFAIAHYGVPTIDEKSWRLQVDGLVSKPLTLTLSELKALPRQEVISTIECGGNNGLPFLTTAIGNARWAGTSLAKVLKSAQVKTGAVEVVFFGADQGEEVLRKGTPLELTFTGNFARSMSLADAMNPANLLCYEMNASPLPAQNGFPLRLVAPGSPM
jgi:DMSO/TMAO reductase YedYZ molybdopterin-dependent catalytic subunit